MTGGPASEGQSGSAPTRDDNLVMLSKIDKITLRRINIVASRFLSLRSFPCAIESHL
jgi:hypothetical protein